MTDKEILEKAYDKAKNNGYEHDYSYDLYNRFDELTDRFIFNHDFAKAFWGEEKFDLDRYMWQIHLERMVMALEPLKYLEKFL